MDATDVAVSSVTSLQLAVASVNSVERNKRISHTSSFLGAPSFRKGKSSLFNLR